MNLILLENDKSQINNLLQNNDIIICFNYLPYLSFLKNGISKEVFFIEDLLTQDDYSKLQKATDNFTSQWYIKNEYDLTQYNGVSYGEITRITINKFYLTSILVKYGEVIRCAISKHNPDHVFCDFSDSENTFYMNENDCGRFFSKIGLAQTVCHQLGFPLTFIPCPHRIPSGIISNQELETTSKTPPLQKIKQLILKSSIFLLECTVNKINNFRHQGKPRIFVQNYPNLLSLLKNQDGHIFIPNLSVANFLSHFRTSFLNLETTRKLHSASDTTFLTTLCANIKNKSSDSYCYNGIEYVQFYQRLAEQLTNHEIPNLLSSRNKLEQSLTKSGIKVLLDIDSEGESAQLRKHICKKNGILYAFVDHGIQGFLADSSLAQLPDYDIRFLAGSYDPYRKIDYHLVTGSPCIDPYFKNRKKEVKEIRRVLFLSFEDNHFARLDRFAFREKYLAEIIPLFPQLSKRGLEIFFRPHNETTDYYQYLFDFFGVESNCIKLNKFHSTPFSEIISSMDLLVCNVSSCFFEAQAAGVPTIFLEPQLIEDSLCLPYSGLNWEEVIRVNNGNELLDIILRNIDDATELRRFLENFLEKHGNKYIGAMDGKSGERIIDVLIQQAKEVN